MCMVSMIMDSGIDILKTHPIVQNPNNSFTDLKIEEVRKQVEDLRKEILELKKLIIAAKKFDDEFGQPDCENDEKIDKLKKIAELVGIDLSDIFITKV